MTRTPLTLVDLIDYARTASPSRLRIIVDPPMVTVQTQAHSITCTADLMRDGEAAKAAIAALIKRSSTRPLPEPKP